MRAERVAVLVRPFAETDYERTVEIGNLSYPEYRTTVEEARFRDRTWDETRYHLARYVAEDAAGRVVGSAQGNHAPWAFDSGRYWVSIAVDPAYRRQGYGGALYELLLTELRSRGARVIRANAKESMSEGVSFLTRRGFEEVQRAWESRLDVATFDLGAFAGAGERLAAQGLAITTLAIERERNPDALRKAYELAETCAEDAPTVDPHTRMPFEMYVRFVLESPNALPEAYFLARKEDRFVGLSNMVERLDDRVALYQGLTGVLAEYRGRGIAMALKVRTVRYARDRGFREIRTWNNTRNQPMLRINEAMGFRKQPVWIDFAKAL